MRCLGLQNERGLTNDTAAFQSDPHIDPARELDRQQRQEQNALQRF